MRTFHWIVVASTFEGGLDGDISKVNLWLTVDRHLEKEIERAKKSKKVDWYPGIYELSRKNGILIVGSDSKTLTPALIKTLSEEIQSQPSPKIDMSSLKGDIEYTPIRYIATPNNESLSPKEFGEKKLGKKK